jgi:type II secretory pathway component PulK
MGCETRGLALCFILVFLVATAIGSALPEFGNFLAKEVAVRAHFFNVYFLVLGVLGIGLALYLGYRASG